MRDLYISIHKKIWRSEEYFIFCIDSKLDWWDPEVNGKEPEYDIFLEFLSDIVFEIAENLEIDILRNGIKKIKDKNHFYESLKKIKSYGQWLFILIGLKKGAKTSRFSPYYLDLQNSYSYDPGALEDLNALIYLEIGIKYIEIQSKKLKEDKLISIINKIAKKFNYNIIYEI